MNRHLWDWNVINGTHLHKINQCPPPGRHGIKGHTKCKWASESPGSGDEPLPLSLSQIEILSSVKFPFADYTSPVLGFLCKKVIRYNCIKIEGPESLMKAFR